MEKNFQLVYSVNWMARGGAKRFGGSDRRSVYSARVRTALLAVINHLLTYTLTNRRRRNVTEFYFEIYDYFWKRLTVSNECSGRF